MSQYLTDLQDAWSILDKASKATATGPNPVWVRVYHAMLYVERQIAEALTCSSN